MFELVRGRLAVAATKQNWRVVYIPATLLEREQAIIDGVSVYGTPYVDACLAAEELGAVPGPRNTVWAIVEVDRQD